MKSNVNIVQESELDQMISQLHRLLEALDERELQVPAVHIANAIDCLERIAE